MQPAKLCYPTRRLRFAQHLHPPARVSSPANTCSYSLPLGFAQSMHIIAAVQLLLQDTIRAPLTHVVTLLPVSWPLLLPLQQGHQQLLHLAHITLQAVQLGAELRHSCC